MKSSVLGYGAALLLVAIALAILVDMFAAGPKTGGSPGTVAAGTGRTQAPTAPAVNVSPSETSTEPAAPRRPLVPAQPTPQGAMGAHVDRCPARSAGYQRIGDTVKVTVNFAGSGYVAAFVEATGREAQTKSATNTGRPLTFEFTGVPKNLTQRIGVTVITGAGLRTCDVQPQN